MIQFIQSSSALRNLRLFGSTVILCGMFSPSVLSAETENICFDRSVGETISYGEVQAEEIEKEHAPWMVNISDGNRVRCGGTLVTPEFIITAAHCLTENPLPKSEIVISQVAENGNRFGDSRKVKDWRLHPGYLRGEYPNDIAVLQLEEAFNVSQNRLPNPLSRTDAMARALPGDCAIVMGWGDDGRTNTVEKLVRVKVKIWTQEKCKAVKWWQCRDLETCDLIDDRTMCAGFSAGGTDSCNRDSGGPLIVPGGQSDHVLAGVVSWGDARRCGQENTAGVYQRMSAFYGWVDKTIKEMKRAEPKK
ncbi:MAG: serine protease [Pseudomonadota bacterium]